ncbi:MAG: ATP synthase F1 subunit delta [Rhodopirellula sp.]|nr:ATP synthase F1 subunit delta [Rhodopirellula sp.]
MPQDIPEREARLAAELQADVTVEHVADVYAEAFVGAASRADQVDALIDELDSLLTDVLLPHPDLERILASALVSHDEKLEVLDRVLAGRASPLLLNFLKVLSRHGRLDLLRAVYRKAHDRYDRLRGRVRVRLTTPVAIDAALAGRIAEDLRGLAAGEPVLEQVIDPTLIGGAVVQIGDTVYDASIAAQLKILRQQMMDRSAHEIQSGRDRFRYPAGN